MARSDAPLGTAALQDGLVQVSFRVMALLSRAAAAHDLSLTQLRLLAILRDQEPKMAELAAHLGLDRSSVSGLIDRAAERGLVQRRASPDDGRAVRVRFTAAGRRLEATLTGEIDALLSPLFATIDGPERRRLAVLLDQLLEAPGASPP